ncbi:dihydropteroate synthase [Rhodobacteraceae bacterium 2376]|uniref:Dihydropteroate synthase n=1 Tax=Rhabdonatronobacter sediminivivens TaxID=2743469 RepID=A0A7Z0HZ12_9RHOB|nr:dihydropteroate synthase [Rhabdonatronobacter sediminivivens]NYS24918.1 dihydropteroate synthase [Rhabdonatronobacter sediminivivens]
MNRRVQLRAQTGFCGREDVGIWPVAGSAFVWCHDAELLERGAVVGRAPLPDLSPGLRARLTDRRADICGLSLDRPRIMGILNVTPDSFSDGGRIFEPQAALDAAIAMARDADILDIGGESTRPGALPVSLDEEINRTIPVIRAIRAAGIATPISIDTRNAAVARAAIEAGADMVNDVSALRHDPQMAPLVAETGVPVCLMHAQGDPQTMQDDPRYTDVVAEVGDMLAAQVAAAQAAGIDPARIIVDPGIGFGKTVAHNMALLRHLAVLHELGLPVLLGASRKRFIGTLTGVEQAADRVAGSVAVALHGAAQGAHLLRVHDVAETRQALTMWQALAGPGEAGQEQGKQA